MSTQLNEVLLVDDEPLVSKVLSRWLKEAGFRVHQAQSGRDALKTLEESGNGVRLVVTDIVMPGMSGVELADQVAQRYPAARLLFISGHPYDHEKPLPGPLLYKPFTSEALVGAVVRLFVGGAGV
jgi:DNA-binding NtrC family response regulator